ncbi:MAG: M23 family metallopeptidase [Spirochaetia bacterium]|nr:M23 family metallopeptidase [Spirochaetia bacterium]
MQKKHHLTRNVIQKLRKKGHEKLTFMIVPHSEKHIIHLQLSKFTVAFIIFIILAVFSASLLSMKLQNNIRGEVNQLYANSKVYLNEKNQYLSKLDELMENQYEIKEKLYNYFEKAELEKTELKVFFSDDVIYRQAEEQILKESKDLIERVILIEQKHKNNETNLQITSIEEDLLSGWENNQINRNFSYNEDVLAYRKLSIEMKQTIQALKTIQNFLDERINVQNGLPYYWPVAGGRFTSFYGPRISPFGYTNEFHLGVDLADAVGTPIFASANGVVIKRGYGGGYGLRLVLQHEYGYQTLYAHLNKAKVKVGDKVKKGQVIGYMGKTGQVTGPHLHYEVKMQNKQINPLPYLSNL